MPPNTPARYEISCVKRCEWPLLQANSFGLSVIAQNIRENHRRNNSRRRPREAVVDDQRGRRAASRPDAAHKSGELVDSSYNAEYREVRASEQATDLVRMEELGVGAGDVVFFGEADDDGTDPFEKAQLVGAQVLGGVAAPADELEAPAEEVVEPALLAGVTHDGLRGQ